MQDHILVATDGSDLAGRGVEHAVRLAKALGARLTIANVSEPYPIPLDMRGIGTLSQDQLTHHRDSHASQAKVVLDAAHAKAQAAGVDATVVHVPDAHPAEAILSAAQQNGATMIVMASHGRRGLKRMILGSQTNEVLAQSPVPVLVVR